SIPPGSWGCTDNFTVCWRGVDRLSLAGRNTPPRSPGRFMIKLLCHAAAIILTSSLLLAPARAQDMTGTWLTGQGDAHIKLAKCNGKMCATIVWLKKPIDAKTGKPPTDDKNPEPAKRSRKLLGLRIFAMDEEP